MIAVKNENIELIDLFLSNVKIDNNSQSISKLWFFFKV